MLHSSVAPQRQWTLALHPDVTVTLQALAQKLTCMHQPEMVDMRLSNYPDSMRQIRQLKSSTIGEQSSRLAALLLCASGEQNRTQMQTSLPVSAGWTADGTLSLL